MIEEALAVFAHEVRTPLTGILAISDLLATSELAERERRWVDTIKAGAEHLASLATLFVDAAKDRHGGSAIREDLLTCGRWRAARAICSPAALLRKGCRPRSRFPSNCRHWSSATPFGCAPRSKT